MSHRASTASSRSPAQSRSIGRRSRQPAPFHASTSVDLTSALSASTPEPPPGQTQIRRPLKIHCRCSKTSACILGFSLSAPYSREK